MRCLADIWAPLAAIGQLVVAIMAIWGSRVSARLAGPRLIVSLRDRRGYVTARVNGKRAIYYHLLVRNQRTWTQAERVGVHVEEIAKKRPDGSFFPEPLLPIQLTWMFPEIHEQLPTIAKSDICDLGYVDEASGQFNLSPYLIPVNFRRQIRPGEAMRVSLVARGNNAESKPLVVEISWDGGWSDNLDEMERHLVIREVPALCGT